MGRLAAFEPGLLVATLSPDPVLAHDPRHTLLAAPFPAFPQVIVYAGAAVDAAAFIINSSSRRSSLLRADWGVCIQA